MLTTIQLARSLMRAVDKTAVRTIGRPTSRLSPNPRFNRS
jgi:hypothetical protein